MQLTSLVSRERVIVLASLGGITLLAWLYLLGVTRDMNAMSDMPGMDMASMPMMPGAESFGVVAAMWVVMMVGMMLPAATPMILLYTTVQRKQGRNPVLMTGLFSAGYLLVWGAFAVAAAGPRDVANPS
jgi:predicted metal-binding membrane protein